MPDEIEVPKKVIFTSIGLLLGIVGYWAIRKRVAKPAKVKGEYRKADKNADKAISKIDEAIEDIDDATSKLTEVNEHTSQMVEYC